MEPETIGRSIPLVITTLVCVICARRAFKSVPRSRRLAKLALACGLAILPALTSLTLARGPEGKMLFVVIGVALVVTGLTAVTLAVRSRIARRADGGTATVAPGAALVLGALSGLIGVGLVLFPFFLAAGGPGAGTPAWVHRVDPPGFELTLPSQAWRKGNADGAREVVRFGCPNPAMVASVMEVRPAASVTAFETAVMDLKRLRGRNPVGLVQEKREPNLHGHDHWWFLGEENSRDGRFLVGMSATWWNKSHAVIVMFEGQHRMASEVGRDRESEAFRSAAQSIIGSVR